MALFREDSLIKRCWIHCAFLSIIIVLTFFDYSNVLHGEPIFDDIIYTFADTQYQSPHSFKELNLWEAFKGGMRPVASFTFSLNYYFWGKDTFSYHLTNLLIHIINAVLVYLFIYITLTLPSKSPLIPLLQRGKLNSPLWQRGVRGDFTTERWTAFLTALLFSLHPIQTESVSYIYQRAESLSSLFYLASLISFILAARQSKARGLRTILYALFTIGFLLALGSKEIAITLPVTAFLYGLFFFEKKGLWKKLAIPGLLILACLIVAAVRLITLREDPSAGYHLKEFTAWEYLLTEFSAITNYLRLLVLPVGQNIDHAYPVSRSILDARTILSITFLSSLLAAATILYRRWRAGSFFILWFFIILLPSSSILPLSDPFVEHRVYLSAMGIFFILSSGIVKIVELHRARASRMVSVAVLSILVIISLLWVATYSRNRLWISTVAMWQDVVDKSSGKARAHYNLGVAYSNKDILDGAIEQYQIALQLNPDYIEAHNSLGRAYSKKGWLDKAIDQYRRALRLKPDFMDAYNNLGLAYAEKGWSDEAIKQYQMALFAQPDYVAAYNNLGLAYSDKGLIDMAIEQYQAALRLKPDYTEAHYNLGLAYRKKGWLDKAIEQLEASVRLKPYYYPEAHNNLGLAYHARGLLDKAIEQYQIVVRLKPDLLQAKNNLGLAYLNKGLFDKAMEQFEAVLRLKPDHLEARNNLGNCYLLLHDYKKALKEYLKALRVDPKYFDAYYNVGLSLRKVGAPDIATGFFIIFVRYGPDKYDNEKRELAQKYNITKDTTLPDIDLLIDRATKVLNHLGES